MATPESASLEELIDAAAGILAADSLQATLRRMAERLRELIAYDSLSVYELDPSGELLLPVFAIGSYADEVTAEPPSPVDVGVSGWVVRHRRARVSERVDLDPLSATVEGTPDDPEALVCVPLMAEDRVVGTLNVYRDGANAGFSEAEAELIGRFATLAALAYDNARHRELLQEQARTDGLTGLYNHRHFHERLREELERATRHQRSVGLLLLDLDDFKRVNDIFGHQVGDAVLVRFAKILRDQARAPDVICRTGGEEFALILPETRPAEAEVLAERILLAMRNAEFEGPGRVTVSCGVAGAPRDARGPNDLFACADRALRESKRSGKDRTVRYEAGLVEEAGPEEARAVDPLEQLKLLRSLAAKLDGLGSVERIAEVVIAELRSVVDYHNCRIHLLREGGQVLEVVGFRGTLVGHEGDPREALRARLGEGISGHVAVSGEPLLVGDATASPHYAHVEGTQRIEESLLAVPLKVEHRTIGALTISKLGLDRFTEADVRLLETLAATAAMALENQHLLEAERRAALSAYTLMDLAALSTNNPQPAEISGAVARMARRMLNAELAAVYLLEDGLFRPAGESGYARAELEALEQVEVTPELVSELLGSPSGAGNAVQEVPLGRLNREQPRLTAVHRRRGLRHVVACALDVNGERVGFLALAYSEPPGPEGLGHADRELLLGIANQAAVALHNARLYRSLDDSYLATIGALMNVLELKEGDTPKHAQEVTAMAIAMADQLGLDAEQRKVVEWAAAFHDIGKIGVAAEILGKPSSLTEEEWARMRDHPALGAHILEPARHFEAVLPVVRATHEHWDGSGYPEGLRGEQIPLAARIILICDAYSAMTSDRPYRAAMPAEAALRQIERGAGTQFDPGLASIFGRALGAAGTPAA